MYPNAIPIPIEQCFTCGYVKNDKIINIFLIINYYD